MGIYRALAKLANYYRRFGFYGLKLLIQIETGFAYKSEEIKAYRVPGYGTVYLRNSASDHAIFWQCLIMQQYDISIFPHHKRLWQEYHRLISSGIKPIILDLGGNIGLSALWFARQFPEARIFVLEPDAGNLKLLKQNLTERPNVTALHGAIWNTPGWLRIVNPEAGFAAYRVAPVHEGDDKALAIRAYTVSQILEKAGAPFPFLVKIDIEGAQAALFSDNPEWVKETSLIILELDDWLLPWQGTSRAFFACISQYPFEYLIRGENIFCFRDFQSVS